MTLGSILVHWADAYAERGNTRGVAAVNLWAGQGLLFLFYAIPTFVIVYYGQLGIDGVLLLIPDRLIAALSVVGGMLPAVGIGLLLRSIGKVRLLPFFLIGFVLAAYLNLPILVIALLGASAAWLAAGDARPTKATGAPAERDLAKQVPRRVLWGAWRRWVMYLHASYNYERLQGLGFAHAIKPAIEYLYETPEERAQALKRHLVLFNSEPQFGALVPAAVIALEEERASGEELSDETINGVKSGLMGPLAGVGDSLIQGLVTPLLLSMGISLAQEGNPAGPILYSLIIATVVLGSSHVFWSLGYRWGRLAVSRILSSGWVSLVSDSTAVVGMTVVGGLTAALVQFSMTASIVVGPLAVSLQQDVLDTVFRGLLPLALTLSSWWLLSRHVPSMRVIGLMFLLGIDLTYLGLTGWDAPSLFSADWVSFLIGGTPATVGTMLVHLWPPLVVTGVAIGVLVARRKTD
jgi:PTS system mannose-specific IID component